MSAEPEDDIEQRDGLSSQEWATWALFGDPYFRPVPDTLKPLIGRIGQAVHDAMEQVRKEQIRKASRR